MQEKKFTISESALQKILNYLGTRPYVEVFELVKAVQSATLQVSEATNAQVEAQESNQGQAAAASNS